MSVNVEVGSGKMDDLLAAMIGSSVNEVSAKTVLISDMTGGQTAMLDELNQKISQVAEVIQSISSTAGETEAAGRAFQTQADKLEELCQAI